MGIHQQRTHPNYVDGCFACKISTVSIGTVPGGAKDERTGIAYGREMEDNLKQYERRKAAGEKPSGITKRSRKTDAYKHHLAEKHLPSLAEDNPPAVVKQVKKALLNQE